MRYYSFIFFAIIVSSTAGYHRVSFAEPLSADSWQMKRLFRPTQSDLGSELKGRVMIYDGVMDKTVARALREQFHRVDAMMFTHVVVTDEDGTARRDADTGSVVYENDGCD